MVNTPFYKEIHAETRGSRLAMKIVPYYSMRPKKVGRIIFNAVRKEARVEMVSVMNDLGFYARFVPFASDIMAMTSNLLLTKRADKAV